MEHMIERMVHGGVLRSPHLIEAFHTIDRARFVPAALRSSAYDDTPLPIGHGQTISQPSTVAFMLELLQPCAGDRVLDIGSGSGWTTALLAHVVGPQGSVLGLERVPELVAAGSEHLAAYDMSWAHIERAGMVLGAPERGPFERILVSAAARTFPSELISQLVEHGVMVVPVRHVLLRAERSEHTPLMSRYEGYTFVPLITEE